MKPKWILALILIVIGLAAYFYFFTGKPYENRSTAEPVINVAGNVFDVSVDECIANLNKEIAKEGLPLIESDYEITKHKGWAVYKVMLSENVMFRIVTYDAEGTGVARIGLSILDSFKYEKGEIKIDKSVSKDEKKIAQKYYELICQCVRPNFKAKTFMKSGEKGTLDFELDGIVFFSNMPTFGWHPGSGIGGEGSDGSEDITVYEAISSNSIYNNYKDEILGGNDNFFIYSEEFRKLNSI
jgi:hypothetical protein